MSKRIVLSCSVCGTRNYRTDASKGGADSRLQLKKYCPVCRKHTVHRQS